ncbi:MAG: hypothetical protein ACHQVK_00325, partial [Candidatus Paceibacterales bacterium]
MSIKTLIPTLILIILVPAFILFVNYSNSRQNSFVSPLGQEKSITQKILEIFMPKPQLTKTVEDSLAGASGTYAV